MNLNSVSSVYSVVKEKLEAIALTSAGASSAVARIRVMIMVMTLGMIGGA